MLESDERSFEEVFLKKRVFARFLLASHRDAPRMMRVRADWPGADLSAVGSCKVLIP